MWEGPVSRPRPEHDQRDFRSALGCFPTGVCVVTTFGPAGYQVTGWIALMAPKGTPREAILLVQNKLSVAAQRPDVRAKLAQMDFEPVLNTPDEFAAEWRAERDTWERLIKSRDIKID